MQHVELGWWTNDGIRLLGRGWTPDGGARAVICLVHGLGEHSGRYGETAAALVAAGYAVLALDLRGHGRSGGPRGHAPSYKALLDDITLLVTEAEQRYPSVPLFLYGHSLGGNLVLGYAMRRRLPATLAGVVASSPWLRLTKQPPVWLERTVKLASTLWPSFTVPNGITPEQLTHDAEKRRELAEDSLAHTRVSLRLYPRAARSGRWLLEHAARFPAPLLLMHGDADEVTSADASAAFAALAPDCTFRLWPGYLHELHNEPDRAEVYRYVVEWLNGRLPA